MSKYKYNIGDVVKCNSENEDGEYTIEKIIEQKCIGNWIYYDAETLASSDHSLVKTGDVGIIQEDYIECLATNWGKAIEFNKDLEDIIDD